MSHTPGPWKVEVTSDGWDGKTTWIVGGDGSPVLYGWGYDAYGLSWGQGRSGDTAEQEAVCPDARLISAAPDLLDAAKAIITWALKNDQGHEGSELLEILSETQSAIAKAEGPQ